MQLAVYKMVLLLDFSLKWLATNTLCCNQWIYSGNSESVCENNHNIQKEKVDNLKS